MRKKFLMVKLLYHIKYFSKKQIVLPIHHFIKSWPMEPDYSTE